LRKNQIINQVTWRQPQNDWKMEAKSEPNCCHYCCHILWAITKQVQVHLNSNIAAYRAQILFALDCPRRASSTVTLVPKNHATAAGIDCTVRWIPAATAPQFAGVMLLRPLHGVAWLHCNDCGWKQSSASCTVIDTSGDRHIKRCTC